VINELLLKIVCAVPPILFYIHRKITGNNHSTTVRHKSGEVELSHKGINDRHTCHATPPPLNDIEICLPIVISAIINPITLEHFVAVEQAPISVEIAPEKLINVNCS